MKLVILLDGRALLLINNYLKDYKCTIDTIDTIDTIAQFTIFHGG